MKDLQEILNRTHQKFKAIKPKFKNTLNQIEKAATYQDFITINDGEGVHKRLNQLGITPQLNKIGLERIIGNNNLMDISFFTKGLKLAKTVGRIVYARNNIIKPHGTGFLVGQNLLMTNNHVLENKYDAQKFMVEFEYEKNEDGKIGETAIFQLAPDSFFMTNSNLDYTIVAVEPIAKNNPTKKLEAYGWNQLSSSKNQIIKGEAVSIIQHPKGLPKMIAIRENLVVDIHSEFIHYTTDTQRGSSGSLVANDQWEIVALHRSSVPKKDKKGRITLTKGGYYQDESDEPFIEWVANQGVLIDAILMDVAKKGVAKNQESIKGSFLKKFVRPDGELEYLLPKI